MSYMKRYMEDHIDEITDVRKRLQDKLRQKFGWKTWSQNNRFTSLIKPEAMRYSHPKRKDKHTISLTIDIFDHRIKERLLGEPAYMGDLTITLTKHKQLDDGTTEAVEHLETYLTLEELEMIYRIAKEKEMEVCGNLVKVK